mmetsp:Transcript_29425/g.39160  ORF Transcript_29425/g.39160 Transcript_29425/m.39160 type:complete len:110 (+) Transcript_29425:145-474(+)
MFHNRWLIVDKAIEPSLIMWENLGYNKRDRCFRICITALAAAILLAITMMFILAIRSYDSELRNFAPVINCAKLPLVTERMAFQDHLQPLEEREGWMHCYCRQLIFDTI